jgi:hypothetical protein
MWRISMRQRAVCTCKSAVVQLTKQVALDYASLNMRVRFPVGYDDAEFALHGISMAARWID